MIKKLIVPCLLLTSSLSIDLQAINEPFMFGQEESLHLLVNNRILAKVNGKAISVIDVMKKMDVLFYRQFPEYTSSISAKFQFYQVNWKHVLKDLIDKELITADAEENKLQVTNGDIRQEMETLFGPNIITNLDKIGMTYNEAWEIVKGDIILKRMMGYRVNSKALREVTPQSIYHAYQEYAKANIIPETFTYQVISIRDKDPEIGRRHADLIEKNLHQKTIQLETLKTSVQEILGEGNKTQVSLSEEFKHSEKEMSNAYKEAVLKLNEGEFSKATAQKSRTDQSTVYRIFFLKEKTKGGMIPFSEVENQIKEGLIDQAVDKETIAYLKKLRSHFDVQQIQLNELNDDNYQPFSLK